MIDANYSVALMLLLKYPAPDSPQSAQSFVDDAIYLRDNFSIAGGANIISKYSGKSPSISSSTSRPTTPLGQGLSPRQKLSRTKSPLPSPARFLQQQGGVEALFQGAAKGVLDRSERLGINQAVRDAVGEVRKNMQGLQASRTSSVGRTSDIMRWSLDEGRSVPASKASVSALNVRNQQLAHMLEHAMADLRAASTSADGEKDSYVKAMEIAIAKVEFVKVYLEDATMPLLDGSSTPAPSGLQNSTVVPGPNSHPNDALDSKTSKASADLSPDSRRDKIMDSQKDPSSQTHPLMETTSGSKIHVVQSLSSSAPSLDIQSATADQEGQPSKRPKAPVPTRSTIAQSSFSWMLEPDTPSGSAVKPPPKSSSPFLKSGRRPSSGPGRERTAFLFGEDGGEINITSSRMPSLADADEVFDLTTIRGEDST